MAEDKQELSSKLGGLCSIQEDGSVVCHLCAHGCSLKDGQRGICRVRENVAGRLVSLVYGRIVAESVDPVEKKPLFHVVPGTLSYSISTLGCNFRCDHCQNSSISQIKRNEDVLSSGVQRRPEDIVAMALKKGCRSISYTYVEPTIFFEFAYDCCTLAAENGLKNIFVSNGYMSRNATDHLAPLLSACNVDLKSFSDEFYKKFCGARLQPVLDNIALLKEKGVWVEVTTLVIPGLNDSDRELTQIAQFLASVDRTIPWHVSGFYPAYKMSDIPPTPLATLQKARQIGLDNGLAFVYAGNRPGSGQEDTNCPGCGVTTISRYGFRIENMSLVEGCCPQCGFQIPGVWL